MKTYIFLFIFFFFGTLLEHTACSAQSDTQAQPPAAEENVMEHTQKTLVIFYTRTGNTRAVAETIKESLGSDMQEIRDLKDRSGIFGFIGGMIDVKKSPITGISPKTLDMRAYDRLFICSPVWGMKFAPAITTFFNTADFTGKEVVLIAVASARIKASSLDEYSALIKTRGGRITGTALVKTIWKEPAEIRQSVQKMIAENKGTWIK